MVDVLDATVTVITIPTKQNKKSHCVSVAIAIEQSECFWRVFLFIFFLVFFFFWGREGVIERNNERQIPFHLKFFMEKHNPFYIHKQMVEEKYKQSVSIDHFINSNSTILFFFGQLITKSSPFDQPTDCWGISARVQRRNWLFGKRSVSWAKATHKKPIETRNKQMQPQPCRTIPTIEIYKR